MTYYPKNRYSGNDDGVDRRSAMTKKKKNLVESKHAQYILQAAIDDDEDGDDDTAKPGHNINTANVFVIRMTNKTHILLSFF